MKVDVFARSCNISGGAPSVAPVGDFLMRHLREVEPRSLVVEVTACFRNSEAPRGLPEGLYEEFQRWLEALPPPRYSPKKERLEIHYASPSLDAGEALAFGAPSLHVFYTVFEELAGLIPRVAAEHRKLRAEVDLPALDAAIVAARQSLPGTAAELATFVEEESRRAAAERAQRSPWELLDIDWSKFHPAARECLDDPFYWDCVDEYAPHGNDTGADILPAFRTWRKRNPGVPVAQFLPLLLKRWGFAAGVAAWQRKPLSDWNSDDESVLTLHDEAEIAIAFAQIKYEAACDLEVVEVALHAIARQLDPALHAHFGWSPDPEREHRLRQMQSLLGKLSKPTG